MNKKHNYLMLADDDLDDCIFFKEAMDDLGITTKLTTVSDGVKLMNFLLTNSNYLPDILFLDLNMPRKSGLQCLSEIKMDDKLKNLPVIILSTSLNKEVIDQLYHLGANYYIRKPNEFFKLKSVIHQALAVTCDIKTLQPVREKFILQPQISI